MTKMRHRRGAVLILTLAVLVMLAMLATVFATITGIEQSVSRNYVDAVRARFVAESGVHAAISALRSYLDRGGNFTGVQKADKIWLYRGEDADLNNAVSAGEWDVNWPPVFPANGKVDTASVPLEVVPNPSFAVEASPTSPAFPPVLKRMTVDGVPRVGISGALEAGTYGVNADIYTLRVMSANSMIYVNDNNPNLPRILNYLCDELGVPRYGDTIYGNPVTGKRNYYGSINDLKKVVPVAAHFDRLAPFLTTETWVDDAVANPVPLSAAELPKYTAALRGWFYRRPVDASGNPIYRAGHGWAYTRSPPDTGPTGYVNRNSTPLRFCTNAISPTLRRQGGIYGLDELNPQWIEVTSRAPIDLNSAPRAILIAILRDLNGFFAMETATNIPHYGYDYSHRMRYDPVTSAAIAPYKCWDANPAISGRCWSTTWDRWHVDEQATLYETMRVMPPGVVSVAGPHAGNLADAILGCRPFKSWEEFHTFCDTLVDPNQDTTPGQRFKNTLATLPLPSPVIRDRRPLWQGYPTRERAGAQAMADVLKANFNPNLHLNELNPNASLLWSVDKTDLIVASTEGTLRPMGVFRIDSLGRVLQPAVPEGDAFAVADNEVVAESRVYATVKVFDVYRATTQKDFYGDPGPPANRGTFAARDGAYLYRTNYGLSVESGPEPHNGPAAQENEWEGYIQLATNGGDGPDGGRPDPVPNDGVVRSTSRGSGSGDVAGTIAHGHFMDDFDLHYGATSTDCRVLTSRPLPGSGGVPAAFPPYRSPGTPYNFPDPNEAAASFTSPYCARYQQAGDPRNPYPHRLARSFRVDKNNVIVDSAGTPLSTFRYAPSDHRVDGAYSERHAALVYSPQNYNWNRGMVEYWIKPGFNVTNAGKIRNYFNLNRLRDPSQGGSETFDPSPFVHSFLPHQVYDLAAGTPYPGPSGAAEMNLQDGLKFDYIKEVLWPGGSGWAAGELQRAKDAIYDPYLESQVAGGNRLGTMVGFKPRSFAFGYAQVLWNSNVRSQLPAGTGTWPPVNPQVRTEAGGGMAGQEIAINTKCLNHAGHPHNGRDNDAFNPRKGDVFEQGHWTHVVLAWHMTGNTDLTGWNNYDHFRQIVQLRVNGRLYHKWLQDISFWDPLILDGGGTPWHLTWQAYRPLPGFPSLWEQDEYGNRNPIRIGSPSILDPRHHPLADTNREEGSYPADSTIDEFSLWPTAPDLSSSQWPLTSTASNSAWNRFQIGRYYKGADPRFTSKMIDLTTGQSLRALPPPAGSAAAAPPTPTYRLYGLYWTAYNDKIYNYNVSAGVAASTSTGSPPPAGPLNVGLTFRVSVDGTSNFSGPSYSNEQYSAVLSTDPNTDITDPTKFQYRFEFTGTSNNNYTLLETPILDDVWIIYGPQQAEILEWVVQ